MNQVEALTVVEIVLDSTKMSRSLLAYIEGRIDISQLAVAVSSAVDDAKENLSDYKKVQG